MGPGGSFIDSATSFGLIRGGHVDATILGGLEVDEEGSLSNWIIPVSYTHLDVYKRQGLRSSGGGL